MKRIFMASAAAIALMGVSSMASAGLTNTIDRVTGSMAIYNPGGKLINVHANNGETDVVEFMGQPNEYGKVRLNVVLPASVDFWDAQAVADYMETNYGDGDGVRIITENYDDRYYNTDPDGTSNELDDGVAGTVTNGPNTAPKTDGKERW